MLACGPHWYQVDGTTRREVNTLWRKVYGQGRFDNLGDYLRARNEAIRQMRPLEASTPNCPHHPDAQAVVVAACHGDAS